MVTPATVFIHPPLHSSLVSFHTNLPGLHEQGTGDLSRANRFLTPLLLGTSSQTSGICRANPLPHSSYVVCGARHHAVVIHTFQGSVPLCMFPQPRASEGRVVAPSFVLANRKNASCLGCCIRVLCHRRPVHISILFELGDFIPPGGWFQSPANHVFLYPLL